MYVSITCICDLGLKRPMYAVAPQPDHDSSILETFPMEGCKQRSWLFLGGGFFRHATDQIGAAGFKDGVGGKCLSCLKVNEVPAAIQVGCFAKSASEN